MVEMTEREQVIAELLYLKHDCLEGSATDQTLDKAIALLKAQEPRVMTMEKAQIALHNDDVVWVELKDKIICAGIRMDGTDYFTMQNNDVLDVTDFDSGEGAEMYGKEVRCWTSRPDQATREATPWN